MRSPILCPPLPASVQPGAFFSVAAAAAPTGSSHRRIFIAVDLSEESSYVVLWAIANYLRPGDATILFLARPTSVLSLPKPSAGDEDGAEATGGDPEATTRIMEDEYNASTISKADGIATPLRDAGFAYDIYLVKGDELQKRLCLEIKRLEVKGIGLNALIIGGKTFGSAPGTSKGTLDHYVHLNACPVIVVPTLLEARRRMGEAGDLSSALDTVDGLHPVPEEKVKYHDVSYPQQEDDTIAKSADSGAHEKVKKARSIIIKKKNMQWSAFPAIAANGQPPKKGTLVLRKASDNANEKNEVQPKQKTGGATAVWPLRRSNRLTKPPAQLSANGDNGNKKNAVAPKQKTGGATAALSLRRSKRLTKSSQLSANEAVYIIYDSRMMQHRPDGLTYEVPERISSIIKRLETDGLLQRCRVVTEAVPVDLKYARAVHSEEYIKFIEALPLSEEEMYSYKDFVGIDVFSDVGTKDAILLAAGAVVQACHEMATNKCLSAYAIVRPPGHHAKRAMANGFCFMNNVAIGARYLQMEHNVKKILLVDFDVHHGDGTQDIFYDDDSVMFISVHSSEIFPKDSLKEAEHIGDKKGKGHNVNVNLPINFEDDDLSAVWDYVVLPLAMQFEPEIILVSAGFDAARGDHLGGCRVTPSCFGLLVAKLREINNKILLVLEGGYNLHAIAKASSECVKALLGDTVEVAREYSPFEQTWPTIVSIRQQLKCFWPVLAAEIDGQVLARWTKYKHDPGRRGGGGG